MGDATNAQPISTTTLAQAQTPLGGDPTGFMAAAGVKTRSLDDILAARPADTQDLWHARLFLLKPALRRLLSAFWAFSGLVVLLTPNGLLNMADWFAFVRLFGTCDRFLGLPL